MPRPAFAPLRILPSPRLLAAGRVLAGLGQRELASAAGLAASSLGRFEMGASTLRADTMDSLLAVLAEHGVRFVQGAGWGVGVMLEGEPKPKIPGKRPKRVEAAAQVAAEAQPETPVAVVRPATAMGSEPDRAEAADAPVGPKVGRRSRAARG